MLGAAAAVCRDHSGKFLGSSAALVLPAVLDPAVLEDIACREPLALRSRSFPSKGCGGSM